MPTFRVLRQQDAFINYEADITAASAEDAVDQAYRRHASIKWEKTGLSEFDACRVVALDDEGNELDVERGKF